MAGERGIIFSAPMVRALLAGTKTQTRRVLKLPTKDIYEHPKMGGWAPTTTGGPGVFTIARDGTRIPCPDAVAIWHQTTGYCMDMPWQVGDHLWVKEACGRRPASFLGIEATNGVESAFYKADEDDVLDQHEFNLCPWWRGSTLSPIHMPRWASRLTLAVTDVRVEPLQDISEADAEAEGIVPVARDSRANGGGIRGWGLEGSSGLGHATARAAYRDLWNSIHGPGAWDVNPWVAALTFAVERRNIDAPAGPGAEGGG